MVAEQGSAIQTGSLVLNCYVGPGKRRNRKLESTCPVTRLIVHWPDPDSVKWLPRHRTSFDSHGGIGQERLRNLC
jgi:hypothetical protein